jgi:hypothetical protein
LEEIKVIATEWVNTTLANHIVGSFILLDDTQFVSIADFCDIFRNSIESNNTDKYAALSGVQTFMRDGIEHTATADELGYQVFFDAWHTEGII